MQYLNYCYEDNLRFNLIISEKYLRLRIDLSASENDPTDIITAKAIKTPCIFSFSLTGTTA
jgi:hypothetical protein